MVPSSTAPSLPTAAIGQETVGWRRTASDANVENPPVFLDEPPGEAFPESVEVDRHELG
jgi:hypothetical protein